VATSSITGPTILHGPHQAAQKSTTTGLFDFNTTSSKVASVIANAIFYIFKLLKLMKDKISYFILVYFIKKSVLTINSLLELILNSS
jgi:hypothetical protein